MDRRALGRIGAAALSLACSTAASGSAIADDPNGVATSRVLVVPALCAQTPWAPAEWIELLRVELSADGIEVRMSDAASASAGAAQVAVEAVPCEASAVSVTLSFASGDARQTRAMDLRDVAVVARPRALAIAMADLVRSGVAKAKSLAASGVVKPMELLVHVRVDPAPALPPPTPEPPDARPLAALFATAEARVFAGASGMFGGRAGSFIPLARRIELGVDVGALTTDGHDALGKIEGTIATLGASVALKGGTKDLALSVGPRIEAGVGWFEGQATSASVLASSARSFVLFTGATAAARFALGEHAAGLVAVDAGTTLHGFRTMADDRTVVSVDGPMISARVGFAWGWSSPAK